jgi:hypothetical protein
METTKAADKMITKLVSIWERAPAELSEPGFGIDIWNLAALSGIVKRENASHRRQNFLSGAMDDLPSAQQFMQDKGWVRISQLGEYGRYSPALYPTPEGVDYVRRGRPWPIRFLTMIEEAGKVIIISAVTSATTTIVTYFILNWLTRG